MREMKDSGIEWVGAIPATWQMHPLYYYFCERKCRNTLGKENNLLSLSYGRVIRKDINTVDGLLPENYNGYNIIEKDDIVLRLTDLQNDKRSLRTGLVREHGIITSAYTTIKANRELVPEFFQYLLHSYDAMKVLYNMGSGVRQGLNFSELSKMPLISPDMLEQKKIADFLDAKCSEIDAISADIQKEIEILEQYKRSVITEAVTKGLNPEAEMKDSGIGYIGIIPNHWVVEKIKYHLKYRGNRNPGGVQVLSVYREYGVIPKDSRDDNHNVTSEDTSNYRYVRVGDFVINKMKAWQGSMAISDYEGIVSPAYYVYEFSDEHFDRKYFHYLLRNKMYATEFLRVSGGIRVGQWDLSAYDFENTMVPMPPIKEQKKIAAFLDTKSTDIDSLIGEKKRQLEVLDSYKKSLIYEYVTGKKEVI